MGESYPHQVCSGGWGYLSTSLFFVFCFFYSVFLLIFPFGRYKYAPFFFIFRIYVLDCISWTSRSQTRRLRCCTALRSASYTCVCVKARHACCAWLQSCKLCYTAWTGALVCSMPAGNKRWSLRTYATRGQARFFSQNESVTF